MIYYKRYTGKLLPQKTAEQPSWVQWTHHSEGKTHCEECLMLDGCWFQEENAPSCPHHPYCHCTLDTIPYAVVLMNTTSYSDYSKFDPYLFDPENTDRHGKNRAFESWGYSVSDSTWLKNQSENQSYDSQKRQIRQRVIYYWMDAYVERKTQIEYAVWGKIK